MKLFIAGLIIGALIASMCGMWVLASLEREIDTLVAYYNVKNNTYINHFRDSVEEASRNLYGDWVTDIMFKWYGFCDGFYHQIKGV